MSIARWALRLGPWALVWCLLSTSHLLAAGRTITFQAENGRTVTAVVMDGGQPPSAAVVLVPMLGRNKDDWQAVGERLALANITSVAIDLPGQTIPEDPKELGSWQQSIKAAVTYLASRPDVRASSIGIAGASLGANLAAVAAAEDPRVRAIALVSPSLDYRGITIERPLRQYGSRPALLIASAHDPYAARTVRELTADAPGPRETQWSETVAHGSVLLARDPDMVRALVEWFQRTLG